MFDDLFDDLFDRDRRDGSQKPKRGLRGLIARVTGSNDREFDERRSSREDERRYEDDDDRYERREESRRRERFDWDDD